MSKFYWLYGIMLILAAVLASVTDCPSLFRLPPSTFLLWAPLVASAAFAAFVVLGGMAMEKVRWYRDMAALLKRMLTSKELVGEERLSSKAFVIAVYSGIGEEAFFRGWLQPWLIVKLEGITEPESLIATALGIVAASLIFGLLHFPVIKELRPWTAFAVLAGIAFGVLAAWSQSLLAPVLAHLLINWLNLRRLDELKIEPPEGPNQPPLP